jgi:hypothetical protein
MLNVRHVGPGFVLLCVFSMAGCGRATDDTVNPPAETGDISYSRIGDTLQADVDGKEKMHLETGEKGVALPPDFPTDVPLYPGATLVLAVTLDDSEQVTLHTDDDIPDVVKFYREQLAASAWKIAAELDVKRGDMISSDKDGRTCSVLLTRKSDNVTVISVTLGKR